MLPVIHCCFAVTHSIVSASWRQQQQYLDVCVCVCVYVCVCVWHSARVVGTPGEQVPADQVAPYGSCLPNCYAHRAKCCDHYRREARFVSRNNELMDDRAARVPTNT